MFSRIGRFFKAVFNAILGEAEGQVPIAMLEESVREMLDNMRSLREATATTIAFETKAKRDRDAQNLRLKNLEKQAEEALRQGNEKLARRALQLQVEAKGTAERAEQTYKAARARAENARTKLKIEEERVQGKIRQLGELKAVHEMNEAQRRMQSITDEYNIDGATSVFDKTAVDHPGAGRQALGHGHDRGVRGRGARPSALRHQPEDRGRRGHGRAQGAHGRGGNRHRGRPRQGEGQDLVGLRREVGAPRAGLAIAAPPSSSAPDERTRGAGGRTRWVR